MYNKNCTIFTIKIVESLWVYKDKWAEGCVITHKRTYTIYINTHGTCYKALLSMGININQHRESIGRHYFASLTVKKSTINRRWCILLYSRCTLRHTSLCHWWHSVRCLIFEPTFDSDSSAIDICKYLFFVLCILLIISGIEINPRPSVASESSSSVSSAESFLVAW
jgi:hypothetical protein